MNEPNTDDDVGETEVSLTEFCKECKSNSPNINCFDCGLLYDYSIEDLSIE
jgi:hypothetical protein